jgi:hypothetical protein
MQHRNDEESVGVCRSSEEEERFSVRGPQKHRGHGKEWKKIREISSLTKP